MALFHYPTQIYKCQIKAHYGVDFDSLTLEIDFGNSKCHLQYESELIVTTEKTNNDNGGRHLLCYFIQLPVSQTC